MSKSLKRVVQVLEAAQIDSPPVEMTAETRTAAQAATAVACDINQIAKSIMFQSDKGCVLFITAGGNNVNAAKAATISGQILGRADAKMVRSQTGFAIGGVSPIGHLNPTLCYFDPKLLEFEQVWAAAGTPRHVFAIAPKVLLDLTTATLADFSD